MNGKPKSPVLPFILGILLLYTTYTRWPETEHSACGPWTFWF